MLFVCKNGVIDDCIFNLEDGIIYLNKNLRFKEVGFGQLSRFLFCRELWLFESNWMEI